MSRIRRGQSKALVFDPKKNKKAKSRTQQHHLDEVNIHNIVGKRERMGIAVWNTHYARQLEYFKDTTLPTFHEAMNVITNAETVFEQVPSGIRSQFHNDPSEFLDFMLDPANKDDIAAYGFTTEYLDDAPVTLSDAEKRQIDIEEAVAATFAAREAPVSLNDASIEQLQAQLDKLRPTQEK